MRGAAWGVPGGAGLSLCHPQATCSDSGLGSCPWPFLLGALVFTPYQVSGEETPSPTYSTFPNKMSRVPVSLLADPMQSGLGISSLSGINSTSLVTLSVKSLPSMRETQVQSLGREDPLEKGMATHSSILAWRIPWTEEPGGLRSMGSQRVGHD